MAVFCFGSQDENTQKIFCQGAVDKNILMQRPNEISEETQFDEMSSPRPISAPQLTEGFDAGFDTSHEPQRCASQLDLSSKKDLPKLPGIGRSCVPLIRDINMSEIKDVDQLIALGLLRLRSALKCRGEQTCFDYIWIWRHSLPMFCVFNFETGMKTGGSVEILAEVGCFFFFL